MPIAMPHILQQVEVSFVSRVCVRAAMTAGAVLVLGCGSDTPSHRLGDSVRTDVPPADSIVDLSAVFAGAEPVDATFLLVRGSTGGRIVHDAERAKRRFRPASTFKIANSIIALETGVATGPEFFLPWDSLAAPTTRRVWARDQTMETAFRNSVYWYYQELARRIGEHRMREWLGRLEYGNQSTGGGIDRFWLAGDLRISPEEQVRFLRRLVGGELPISPETRATVIDLMKQRDTTAYRLYGKTGTSDVTPTRENGWIVGWVETVSDTLYYALNMEGESVWEDWPPDRRVALVERIMARLALSERRSAADIPLSPT